MAAIEERIWADGEWIDVTTYDTVDEAIRALEGEG